MLRHDVRGALQGVIGGVPARSSVAGARRAQAREQFERIAAAARTLRRLVGDARRRAPDGEPAPRASSSRASSSICAAATPARRAARGLELRRRGRGRRAERPCASTRWRSARVIDNLVGNALKFSGAGAVAPDRSAATRRAASSSASPTRARASPRRARSVRGGRGRAATGQGLGLAHRPHRSPSGSAATVELGQPAGRRLRGGAALPAEVAAAGPPPARPPSPTSPGLRVLLAEDNPTNQMVASQMLRALNAEVTVCADGVEALERFEPGAVRPRGRRHRDAAAVRARRHPRDPGARRRPGAGADRGADRLCDARAPRADRRRRRQRADLQADHQRRGAGARASRPTSRGRARAAPRPAPRATAADGDGPVIDAATFDALVRGDRRRDDGRAPRQGRSPTCSARSGELVGGAADARPRADPLGLAHPDLGRGRRSGRCGCRPAPATLNAVGARPRRRAASPTRVRRCIAEIDAAVAFAARRRAAAEGRRCRSGCSSSRTPPSLSMLYQSVLTRAGHGVTCAFNLAEARAHCETVRPQLVLLDLQLPDGDGLELLHTLRRECAGDPGHRHHRQRLDQPGGAGDARRRLRLPGQAVRRGAAAQRRARTPSPPRRTRSRRRPAAAGEAPGFQGFIGRSAAMAEIYRMVRAIGRSTATVFITGESGTGKEVCARAIHAVSTRAAKPFVPLNCAAIPRDLLESEVFGHLKGAFTGALSDKPGAAAVADGGTLFLDEICEMDLSLQTKLLRFLQTSTIQPVGAARPIPVDVRIVCATNRDPAEEVRPRPLPRGPLLPPARRADPHAAAARAARGHHGHRPGEPRRVRRRGGQGLHRLRPRGGARC